MSYYSDLFLRPKQATAYAFEHPSISRSLAFVVLGALAAVLAGFVFAGTFFPDIILTSLLGDLSRWLVGGLLIVLVGVIFKRIPLNGDSISRTLSVFAQLNLYGFFLFLVLGILLPAVAIPGLISASQAYNHGVIGETEFSDAVNASFSGTDSNIALAFPLVLLAFVLILYSIYSLYLSVQKVLNITVFKTILMMILIVGVQGALVLFFNSLGP